MGMETKEFRSPIPKLVPFFRTSRGGWKRKCQEAKQINKLLGNQVRAVERSRARWKEKALAEARVGGGLRGGQADGATGASPRSRDRGGMKACVDLDASFLAGHSSGQLRRI